MDKIEKSIKGLKKGWLFFVVTTLALLVPFVLLKFYYAPGLDIPKPDSLGDIINVSYPFLTAIAIWVTFRAFFIQYVANEEQKSWNTSQRNDIVKERFETKLFQLLELLNKQEGLCKIEYVGEAKQAFHYMFYEFKAILYVVMKAKLYAQKSDSERKQLEFAQSYHLFINGVSETSIARLLSDVPGECRSSIYAINTELLDLQKKALQHDIDILFLMDYKKRKIKRFDGHRVRLVSFYRHVCLIVQYIYEGTNKGIKTGKGGNKDLITADDREFYLHLICSQLSEHELALLLIMYEYGREEHYCPAIRNVKALKEFFKEELPKYFSGKMNCREDEFTKAIKDKTGSVKQTSL